MPGLNPSQEVLDSPQYEALSSYLADANSDLDGALNAFCRPIEDRYKTISDDAHVDSLLWIAWQGVVAIAASTPYSSDNRDKLVKFVVRSLYRPNLINDDRTCEIHGMIVWRDLPVLGWELREAWNFGMPALCVRLQG